MKKVLSVILTAVLLLSLVFSFTGCGTEKSGDGNASSIKVGAIYINSQNDTAGYTFAHHNGISTAIKNLGIPTENLYIIDNVPEDDTEVSNAIDTLAGKGCNIIFGISFGYINAFAAAAEKEEYSDIIFSHATGYLSNETNFNNYFGRIYQARYLSGIAAGMKSAELGNNNIGYVAAWGTEYAETCSGINAFALGVQSVNPEAVVHVNKISTWGDETLEKQAAQSLIDTYDCCVIGQHCDSAQPQLVAADNKIFGCGYNSDMTEQAPTAHLTAPVWNWNVYYELAIKTAMEDPQNYMSKVGNYYGGLKEDFVDVSAVSKNNTEGTDKVIGAVKKLMVDGEWDVFSGVKLNYTKNSDGSYTVNKSDAQLKTNDGTVVVEVGGASVGDDVIKGSMNYYVEGVIEG